MKKSNVLWVASILLGASIVTSCQNQEIIDTNTIYQIKLVYNDGESYLYEAKGGSLINLDTFTLPEYDYKKVENFYLDEEYNKVYDYNQKVKANLTLYVKLVDNSYDIKTLKDNNNVGEKVVVSGVVGYKKKLLGSKTDSDPNGTRYNDQIDCFYLFDDTGSILIYDKYVTDNVKVGNKITLQATYTTYILWTEIEYANKAGYTGSRQLTNATIVSNDNLTTNKINQDLVKNVDLYDITVAPTNINITSNVYNVHAKIKKSQEPGYLNYYLYDPIGVGSTYVYTNNNGSDYAWLDEFDDDEYHNVVIAIYNAKCASNNSYYRIIPLEVNEVYKQTDLDIAKGAAVTISNSVNTEYFYSNNDVTLDNQVSFDSSSMYKDCKINITSSDTSIIDINSDNKIIIKSKEGSANVTFKASLNGVEASVSKVFNVISPSNIITTNINDIYNNSDSLANKEVSIKGIVVGYAWKSKAGNKGVYYINDGTNTILVSPNNESLSTELEIGQEVIYTGTYKVQDSGDRSLNDANLKYYTTTKKELNYTFKTVTVNDLYNNYSELSKENISGQVFECSFIVGINDGSYSKTAKMIDLDNNEVFISVYSGSFSNVEFLEKYEGKKVKAKIGIRDEYYKSRFRVDVLNETIEVIE